MTKILLALALVVGSVGCGDSSTESTMGGLAGTWESTVAGGVTITVVLSGSATSGTARLSQTTTVGGDTPTCRSAAISDGAYSVSGSSITITATSGHQTTSGCSFPDSDTQITDLQPLQSFAGALSGPFILSENMLKLGNAYPTLNRVTR